MRYLLAIALLAAAAIAAARHRAPTIEETLRQEVVAAMAGEGLADVEVAVDGRDVTLSGEVADIQLQELAKRSVESVPGVRSVSSSLAVSAPTPQREEPPVVSWDSCQAEIDERLAAGRIDFESSRAEITPATGTLLEALKEVLEDCGEARIEIGGHTDASGPRQGNLDLSLRRAEAVKDWFVAAGIDAGRLTAAGYGPDQPLVDNSTPEGRALNRRIELHVQDP